MVGHEANTRGRDPVAGSIRGHFDTLEHAVEQLAFDPHRGCLFSVGDLIDRGPRSQAAHDWIESTTIAPVRVKYE